MKTLKVSKNVTIIKKGDKYFRHDFNRHACSHDLQEINFDKDGSCTLRTGNCCYYTYYKYKLDLLFDFAENHFTYIEKLNN